MIFEGKIITYAPNGHKYLIDKDISPLEAKAALARLDVMYKHNRESVLLEKKLAELHQQEMTPQVAQQIIETLLKMADINERAIKAHAEITTMMRETLFNCFNLTIADLDKIDNNEQINIFLQLVEMCK